MKLIAEEQTYKCNTTCSATKDVKQQQEKNVQKTVIE